MASQDLDACYVPAACLRVASRPALRRQVDWLREVRIGAPDSRGRGLRRRDKRESTRFLSFVSSTYLASYRLHLKSRRMQELRDLSNHAPST